MDDRLTTICRKLTLLGLFAVLVKGEAASKEKFKRISLYNRHYDCIPTLHFQGGRLNSTLLPGGTHVQNVTLQFNAFGRPFTVDLFLNNNLFPTSYIEKVIHSHGQSVETQSLSQPVENCFYHGHLRFQPESHVAISTCNGFAGYITDRHDTYHLEPWKGSIHRVYRDKDRRKIPFRCGTDSHDSRLHNHLDIMHRVKRAVRAPYDSNKNTRYVELYLVNDYRTFVRFRNDKRIIIQRSQDIANIVSSLYRQLNIYVALVGVELWASGDLISITSNADNTMENFLRYRKERINPFHHNDNAQLLTGVYFDNGVVGKAIKGPICTHQFSGGVNMDYAGSVTHVATTVAHEMGHNFGMQHDNDTTCECRDEKCIMAATSGSIYPSHWSSCSQSALAEAFDLGMDYCLRNIPTFIFNSPTCGNGFKEDGEECDCGSPKDCTNRCCNPQTCQLHPVAECATGRCCDLNTCKLKTASTLCREPIGECDLAEFCNGTMEYCPPDVHVHDAKPCMDGQSYCYKGQCNTHTKQCKLLWGDSGQVSNPICFQNLNMKGNYDGACSYNLTTMRYHRCNKEDVMCGLLHCVHLNEKLMFWRDNLALETRAAFLSQGQKHVVCRSAILDVGLDMHDPGFVADGAKCEHNKVCINQKCTPLAKLRIKPCQNGCNGHGTCNSNGNCHCDVGYAPPFCDKAGSGGSFDSGPASNEDGQDQLLIALLVVFLLILPIAIVLILAYLNKQRLWKWWKTMPSFKDRVKKNTYTARPPRPTLQPTMSHSSRGEVMPPPYHAEPVTKPFISPTSNQKTRIWNPHNEGGKPPGRPIMTPKMAAGYKHHPSNNMTQKPLLSIPVQETEGPSLSDKPSKSNQIVTSAGPGHVNDNFPSLKKGASQPEADATNSPKTNRVIKRDSFRGAEISHPVLKSTTNRNSVVESLQVHVDIIGPEANKPMRSPSPNRPNSRAMRRSHSDRTVPHQDPSQVTSPVSDRKGSPLKKSASTKSPHNHRKDLRNNPTMQQEDDWEDDDDRVYCNDVDVDDLVSSINKTLGKDSIYRNVPNEADSHKPVQETDPPAIPSRALKYQQKKPNQSLSLDSDNPPTTLQSNNEAASSKPNAFPNKFTKPSPPKKSSSLESKNPPKKPTPTPASPFNKNILDELKQTKASNLSRPKMSNSFSSASPRKPGDTGTKEVPSLSHKPATKTSFASSDRNFSKNNKVTGGSMREGSASDNNDTSRISAPKASVSNLAAKFNQNSGRTSSPTSVKDLETPRKSSLTERPSIAAKPGDGKPKPSLAPKPKEQAKKPVPPKPDSAEVKRVRSFKI